MAEIRAFVCGHPVAHSRSPLIHLYWLRELGLPGTYQRIDVAPDRIRDFVRGLPGSGYAGGNVTIPHKEAAFETVDRRDDAAEMIGAVNTLWLEEGEVIGGNTDSYGFTANLDDLAPDWRDAGRATVLGAGGASRAVVHALRAAGLTEIRVANRTEGRARELADRFGPQVSGPLVSGHGWEAVPELLADTQLLVNTTPLGMHGAAKFDVDLGPLPDSAIVSDIVYVPLKTPLIVAAEARGLRTVDGLGMLLHQAVAGFERWFGVRPGVSGGLRAHILADLGEGQ